MLLIAATAVAVAAVEGAAVAFRVPRFSASFWLRRVTEEECLYIQDPLGSAPFPPGTAAAIHIGNTKSCIALPSPSSGFCIPSWIAFASGKEGTIVLTGEAARDHAALSPGTAVSAFMRLLNRRLGDPVLQQERRYNFTEQLGRASIQLPGEVYSPPYLAGILISELKRMAEAHLGREIENAVITVPRHITYDGRQSLRFAAGREQAGFRASRVVDHQIAAAAAHSLHMKQGDGKVVLVLHVGGRTSHATIFKFDNGIARLIKAQDHFFLGGDDFTARVVDHFVDLIKHKRGIDIRHDRVALHRLTAACKEAKKALSQQEETIVQVESLIDGVDGLLTRAKFEELNRDLFDTAMGLVDWVVMQALVVEEQSKGLHYLFHAAMEMLTGRSRAAESRKDLVDEILLVGGSSRIPKIHQLVKDYFHGREPSNRGGVAPDEAIVHGAQLLTHPHAAGYLEECYWGPRLPLARPWPCLNHTLCLPFYI